LTLVLLYTAAIVMTIIAAIVVASLPGINITTASRRQDRLLTPLTALKGVDQLTGAHHGDVVADQHRLAQIAGDDQQVVYIELGADIT